MPFSKNKNKNKILNNKKIIYENYLALEGNGFTAFIMIWTYFIFILFKNNINLSLLTYFNQKYKTIACNSGSSWFSKSVNTPSSIINTNNNDFNLTNINLALLIILAGPMTLIPLFLYVKGVELSGLGASGMIFFITPTSQFLLGYFYFNEPFSNQKFISFIIIWIAVFIYLKDLYEKN